MLAEESPAIFVAWDLLALDDEDLRDDAAGRAADAPRGGPRRRRSRPIHLTPATRDRATAADWFDRFEGAGPRRRRREAARRAVPAGQAGDAQDQAPADRGLRRRRVPLAQERARARTSARCCSGCSTTTGTLHHVGITSSFTWDKRAALAAELAPLRERRARAATRGSEWAEWATTGEADASGQRLPGATSRWNRGKDLSWEPLRIERVAEVAYDHLQGDRFRHGTTFKRWRPDKPPEACRYDQLEETAPYLLASIFGS